MAHILSRFSILFLNFCHRCMRFYVEYTMSYGSTVFFFNTPAYMHVQAVQKVMTITLYNTKVIESTTGEEGISSEQKERLLSLIHIFGRTDFCISESPSLRVFFSLRGKQSRVVVVGGGLGQDCRAGAWNRLDTLTCIVTTQEDFVRLLFCPVSLLFIFILIRRAVSQTCLTIRRHRQSS